MLMISSTKYYQKKKVSEYFYRNFFIWKRQVGVSEESISQYS